MIDTGEIWAVIAELRSMRPLDLTGLPLARRPGARAAVQEANRMSERAADLLERIAREKQERPA